MAIVRTNLIGKPIGLYDSDTDQSLLISTVVDITDHCVGRSHNERVLLRYTQARRGRIVEVVDCYAGKDFGVSRHFFFDEMKSGRLIDRDLQECWNTQARSLGMNSQQLLAIVLEYAPAVERCGTRRKVR